MSAASHPIPAPVKPQPTLAPKPVHERPSSGRPWKWIVLVALIVVAAYLGNRALNKPAVTTPIVAVKTAKVAMGNLERTIRVEWADRSRAVREHHRAIHERSRFEPRNDPPDDSHSRLVGEKGHDDRLHRLAIDAGPRG